MTLAYSLVTTAIKGITHVLCRIDAEALERVPTRGPLIMVVNHVNFLDGPIMYTQLQPRKVIAFAKTEAWENPLIGALFNLWGVIPLRRGVADTTALREGLAVLKREGIVAIAPEGTRTNDGILVQGSPGVVMLAQHSSAPLLPAAYYGGERFKENFRSLRRTGFHIRVGKPFHLNTQGVKVNRDVRQRITDEIMFQLAALLPENYRGVYKDMDAATSEYLKF